MLNKCNNPIVVIHCQTFNQEPYIRQCLDGFVMQKTDFPFAAIIIDDASTDNEPKVLWDFINSELDATNNQREETNDYIKVVAHHKTNCNCTFVILFLKYNHYSMKKTKRQYIKEWDDSAKYIAICEGDDYWTDSQKLQKQVEFLDNHPNYTMCYHAVNYEKDRVITGNDIKNEKERDITPAQMIEGGGGFCATCSLVYRSQYINDMPNFRQKAHIGDWPAQILYSIRGNVRYFPDIMGVYRKNVPGSWTSRVWKKDLSIPYSNNIEWLSILNQETNRQYEESILKQVSKYLLYLLNNGKITPLEYAERFHQFSTKSILKVCGLKILLMSRFQQLYSVLKKYK